MFERASEREQEDHEKVEGGRELAGMSVRATGKRVVKRGEEEGGSLTRTGQGLEMGNREMLLAQAWCALGSGPGSLLGQPEWCFMREMLVLSQKAHQCQSHGWTLSV